MATKTITVTVCDVCGREPNGQSPDILDILSCGHDVCNECCWKKNKGNGEDAVCPVCGKPWDVGRPVR